MKEERSYPEMQITIDTGVLEKKVKDVFIEWGWEFTGNSYGGQDTGGKQQFVFSNATDAVGKQIDPGVIQELVDIVMEGGDLDAKYKPVGTTCGTREVDRESSAAEEVSAAGKRMMDEASPHTMSELERLADTIKGLMDEISRKRIFEGRSGVWTPGRDSTFRGSRSCHDHRRVEFQEEVPHSNPPPPVHSVHAVAPTFWADKFKIEVTAPERWGTVDVTSGREGEFLFLEFGASYNKSIRIYFRREGAFAVAKEAARLVMDDAVISGLKDIKAALRDPERKAAVVGAFMNAVRVLIPDTADVLSDSLLSVLFPNLWQKGQAGRVQEEEAEAPEPSETQEGAAWHCIQCGAEAILVGTFPGGQTALICENERCKIGSFNHRGKPLSLKAAQLHSLEAFQCPLCGMHGRLKLQEGEKVIYRCEGEECRVDYFAGALHYILSEKLVRPKSRECPSCTVSGQRAGMIGEVNAFYECKNPHCPVAVFDMADAILEEKIVVAETVEDQIIQEELEDEAAAEAKRREEIEDHIIQEEAREEANLADRLPEEAKDRLKTGLPEEERAEGQPPIAECPACQAACESLIYGDEFIKYKCVVPTCYVRVFTVIDGEVVSINGKEVEREDTTEGTAEEGSEEGSEETDTD